MINSLLSIFIPTSALREKLSGKSPKVTNIELFFDLVYVLTIIQLSHFLLEHLSLSGALEVTVLFAAVWWAWNYTAWAANWLNPDHASGRVLMLCLMACALCMAVAIPHAFDDTAALFVGAYVTMALLRAAYMTLLFRGQDMSRNYAQLGIWSALSGVFWVLGVIFPQSRLIAWIVAVLLDYVAPYTGFWVPGLGSTPMSSWPLSGLHLLERNQLIFIIALGESILLLGGTLIGVEISSQVLLAAIIGFVTIVLLWWLYFLNTTEEGEYAFDNISDHTRLARSSLAYSHGIMVAGAIVVAVAIERLIAHPEGSLDLLSMAVIIAGPSIYLLGSIMFFQATAGEILAKHVIAIGIMVTAGLTAYLLGIPAMWLGAGVTIVLGSLVIFSRPPHHVERLQ